MDIIDHAYPNDIFKVTHNKFRGFQYFNNYFDKLFVSTKIIFKIYIKLSAWSITHNTQRNEQPPLTFAFQIFSKTGERERLGQTCIGCN